MSLSKEETCFLWGPRQTGKSNLLKTLFEVDLIIRDDIAMNLIYFDN